MDSMEFIKLPLLGKYGKGKFTIVDGDYDGEYFSQFKWYVLKNGYTGRVEIEKPVKDRKGYVYLHIEVSRPPKGMWVDHINRDKLDNRSCNLRWVTPRENAKNRAQPKYELVEGVTTRGVHCRKKLKKKKYVASIKGKHIGYYATEKEAAIAYDKMAFLIWGNDAVLNYPKN